MIIRQLTAIDDLAGAILLLQRFFHEEGFDTPADTIAHNARTLATIETCGLFIAETGGTTIGVATISMEFGIEFGWSAEMGDLYVLPEHRGQGVSNALAGAIEVFLLGKGAFGYQVTVTPYAEQHHALRGFYQKLGFADEGRLILYKILTNQSQLRQT